MLLTSNVHHAMNFATNCFRNNTTNCFKQLVVFLKPFVAVITCRDIQHSPDAVAPGLCWADRGGWDVVDAGGVPVCRVRQYVDSCHMYIVSICTLLMKALKCKPSV